MTMQDQNLPLLSCARADDTALFAELFYRRTADVNLDYSGEVRCANPHALHKNE